MFDEPPHIASGLSYLSTGVFHANPQHPPLLKEIAAVSLLMAGIRWPDTEKAQRLVRGGYRNLEWSIGHDLIRSNGPDRVMFWARLPFIILAGVLGLLIYLWGRELTGDLAALFALLLYVLDPIILAHSYLVTTDVGVAAFTILFLYALWRYLQRPERSRLLWCGLALGAALGSKFSAVVLAPVSGLLLLAAWRWPPAGAAPTPSTARVGPNSPCPCGSGKKYKKCHGADAQTKATPAGRSILVTYAIGFLAMCGIAVVVIEVAYLFSNGPSLYLDGLRRVNADHVVGHMYYLHGQFAEHFMSYFVVAYTLKEPLAAVILAVVGLVVVLRSKSMTLVTKLFLVVPPSVLFLAYSMGADNMGVRYIIPTLPFAFLVGGAGLAALVRHRAVWGRTLAAVFCVWLIVAAIGIYPDHLSYFNELACVVDRPGQIGLDGGTRCGPAWLDDSNVDWGQGIKQLKRWLDEHGEQRAIHFFYFGSQPPDTYGLRYDIMDPAQIVKEPAPGLYVVSASTVARSPAAGAEWLARIQPKAIVGHALYVFEIPQK